MALDLLERGVDPSPLTKASWNVVRNEWSRRYNRGETALDVVRKLATELRKYNGERNTSRSVFGRSTSQTAIKEPRGTKEFLSRFTEGS